jgi:hypothetical protein
MSSPSQAQPRVAGRTEEPATELQSDPFAGLSLPKQPVGPQSAQEAAERRFEPELDRYYQLSRRAEALPEGSAAFQQVEARFQILDRHMQHLMDLEQLSPDAQQQTLLATGTLFRQIDSTLTRAEDGSFSFWDKQRQMMDNVVLEHVLGEIKQDLRAQEPSARCEGQIHHLFESVQSTLLSIFPEPLMPSAFSHGLRSEPHIDRRRQEFESLITALGTPGAVERTTFLGNPDVGTVVHVGQVHGTKNPIAGRDRDAVVAVQGAMFRYFTENRPDYILCEALTANLKDMSSYTDYARRVKDAFPDGTLGNPPTARQASCLFDLGAGVVYGCLNPECGVGRTTDPAFHEKVIEEAKRHPERWEALIKDAREARAVTEVSSILRKHPGATIYVEYGADHRFGAEDYPATGGLPQMRRVDWPGLAMTSPVVATDRLIAMRAYPDLQARLIEKAQAFTETAKGFVPESLRDRLEHSGKLIDLSLYR